MELINKIKDIADNFSHDEIGGVLIDAQTANVILTVYNALSDQNKEKFLLLDINKMAQLAWKLVAE